jgi:hypothetical protein
MATSVEIDHLCRCAFIMYFYYRCAFIIYFYCRCAFIISPRGVYHELMLRTMLEHFKLCHFCILFSLYICY